MVIHLNKRLSLFYYVVDLGLNLKYSLNTNFNIEVNSFLSHISAVMLSHLSNILKSN